MEERREEHAARTRYLRPVEPISFSANEMLAAVLSTLCPSDVSSITQLHGERKGVIRVTFTSREAVNDLDTKVATRKFNVNGVLAAEVKDTGQFVKVILLDVPDYLSSCDLEAELLPFGPVAYIKRSFHDIEGYTIDSEVRHVLYSWLDRELPGKVSIDGHQIFITSKLSTPTKIQAEKDSRLVVAKPYMKPSVLSRSASPLRSPSNENQLFVTEKPPAVPLSASSLPTSPMVNRQPPMRRGSLSVAAQIVSPDEGKSPKRLKGSAIEGHDGESNLPNIGGERISYEVGGERIGCNIGGEPGPDFPVRAHKQDSMKVPDLSHYVEIIESPHGTLPRKIYHKVSEVVETPVEEVKRNLSPYLERHQLRLQSGSTEQAAQRKAIADNKSRMKSTSTEQGQQDIVEGWKPMEKLAPPAGVRQRRHSVVIDGERGYRNADRSGQSSEM